MPDGGKEANESYKYFGTALNRTTHFASELNADEQLLSRFLVSSAKLTTAVAGRGSQLSDAISNATTAFNSINTQNVALDESLRELPPVLRQANTTFVNLRAALDDVEPLVEHGQAGDQEPGPVPRRTAAGAEQVHPLHPQPRPGARPSRPTQRHAGIAGDAAGGRSGRPRRSSRTPKRRSRRSSRSSTSPAPTRLTSSTPSVELGSGGRRLRRQRELRPGLDLGARTSSSTKAATLTPITRAEQFNGFTSTSTPRRCPGGATSPAADNSNPYVDPPHSAAAASAPPNATRARGRANEEADRRSRRSWPRSSSR